MIEKLKKFKKIVLGISVGLPFFLLFFIPVFLAIITTTNRDNRCGEYQEIELCDTGNDLKDIAWANQNWNKTSDQYKIWNCASGGCAPSSSPIEGETEYGNLKKDDLGFYYIEDSGIKYYCNAMASYYTSNIGDKFRITTDEGNVFHIIIADQKADQHTHAGNNSSNGHCLSGTGGMLEFYVDKHTFVGGTMNQNFDEEHSFKGAVTKVEKLVSGDACMTVSTDYVQWMIQVANDNSHGYSQSTADGGAGRTFNPDVDCSSFVYYALLNNGYNVDQLGSYPFTTFTMGNILKQNGFEELDYTGTADLIEGDILVSNVSGLEHTETYIGNGMTVGAHAGNQDGKVGDSSGNEISIIPNSTHESLNGGNYWQHVYRPRTTANGG